MCTSQIRIGGMCLLLLFCAVVHADDRIPDTWNPHGSVIEMGTWTPIYDLFDGPGKVVGRGKAPEGYVDMLSVSQIFVIWEKAVFRKPRKTENNLIYTSEAMEIKIDCPKSHYTVLRDIKFGPNNKIILDEKNHWKSKYIDILHNRSLGELPLDMAFATERIEFTCLRDTE